MKTVSGVSNTYHEKTVGKLEIFKCARRHCVTIWRDIREHCSNSGVNEAICGNCMKLNMVSTNPPIRAATLNRRNTFCGIPKAEIERRNIALLQAMTVSLVGDFYRE